MTQIKINTANTLGRIKPMHAGGQPPIAGARTTHFHYLTEAGIPYSRLHDVGGAFAQGKFVDIPNLFRNFDADENDPASYDFTFTDHLIKGLFDAGVEPYFRLGITIENYVDIKAYYTAPPKDFAKWARICEHVIAHYTEGWADGFHYPITYWEIWNEPDNGRDEIENQMWSGTPEQYYELYDVTAKHLKARFPHLKIGGYASCGFYAIVPGREPASGRMQFFVDFFHGFMNYIKEHRSPIDFFSWHSYGCTKETIAMDEWLQEQLVAYGYGDLETHLNEWDPYCDQYGTAHHSAEVAATMIAMQHGHTDICCIYDMRTNTAPYCPLFDIKTHKPIHAYYSMVAFNALYKLGTQVETVCDKDGLYVLAAANGSKHALMISNLTGEKQELAFTGADLADARFYVIDQERLLSWAPNAAAIDNNAVMLIEW